MRLPATAIFLFIATFAPVSKAESLVLLAQAQVNSDGVYLCDLLQPDQSQVLPRIRLTNSPAFGSFLVLSRGEISQLPAVRELDIEIAGADKVRVLRSARILSEQNLKELLTETIQTSVVKDRGELDLRFVRSWTPVRVPDEPLSIKLMELPASGISAHFICKFELRSGEESFGTFSLPLQASLWNEIYVAASPVLRGQLLREADLARERRDLLVSRDAVTSLPLDNPHLEFAENIRPGLPVTARSLKFRTVVKRGRQLDALLAGDGLKVTAKVEALEDGIPGQVVRVRNVRSKKELKGKVQDEQTVQVLF